MAGLYEAGVLTANPGTINNAFAALWNLSGSRPIWLREIMISTTSTGGNKAAMSRLSARGTQTATQLGEPIDTADPAGAAGTVDFTYSVQPTLTGNLFRRHTVVGRNQTYMVFMWWGGATGLRIAAGAGFGLINPQSVASAPYEAHFIWEE